VSEYTAIQGDTWDMISFRHYGSEYHISELILANPVHVDVVIFEGGEKLNIPTISITDTSLLAPWRR
jgi:phage tail protein X